MEVNGILNRADYDQLRNKVERLSKKISARKENLEDCKQKLDVYLDLANTFYEISDKDYLEKLEQEERERKERKAKKRRKSL